MVVELDVSTNVCPECGGQTINVIERGETVCQLCGLVISEKDIDVSHSGIRAYSKNEKDKK
jgi:transcription initiation factor TFIIB